MKIALCTAALALTGVATSAQALPLVNFQGGSTTQVPGTTIIEDFDELATGSSIGSNAFALDTTSDIGAIPALGSSGNYGSVLGGGSYSISFAPTSLLSFVVGSIDTYNTLTLSFADSTTHDYQGGAIIDATSFPSGDRASPQTNGVLSFDAGSGPKIVGATFSSAQNSFEIDKIAVSAAPEPATWLLSILGFGLIGVAIRRRTDGAGCLGHA